MSPAARKSKKKSKSTSSSKKTTRPLQKKTSKKKNTANQDSLPSFSEITSYKKPKTIRKRVLTKTVGKKPTVKKTKKPKKAVRKRAKTIKKKQTKKLKPSRKQSTRQRVKKQQKPKRSTTVPKKSPSATKQERKPPVKPLAPAVKQITPEPAELILLRFKLDKAKKAVKKNDLRKAEQLYNEMYDLYYQVGMPAMEYYDDLISIYSTIMQKLYLKRVEYVRKQLAA